MSVTEFDLALKTANVSITLIVLIVGVIWTFKVLREYKYRIQLDIDANLYKLKSPVEIVPFTPFSDVKKTPHPYAVEVLLKFANKGKTRFKLYNVRIKINTMAGDPDLNFHPERGHLRLTRIFTSGHVVPVFRVKKKPIEKTSFYYIEPGVVQTIHFLALITEPRDLLQIIALFNIRQRRFSLEDMKTEKGLYPHGAVRTFQIRGDGSLVGNTSESGAQ